MHPALCRALQLLVQKLPAREEYIQSSQIQEVGRNAVWRISVDSSNGHVYYAKHVASNDWFTREVLGHSISRQLAMRHQAWIMAADVVATDASIPLIVTKKMPGESIASLFRRNLRRDQNIFGKRHIVSNMLGPWRRLHEWLQAFHLERTASTAGIHDHTVRGVCKRLETKIQLLRSAGCGGVADRCTQLISAYARCSSDDDDDQVLTYGDCTAGNFFWHEGRIGAIEFEDVGIGSARRDWMCLYKHAPWHVRPMRYWKLPGVNLAEVPSDTADGAIYELEWRVDELRHITHATQTHNRIAKWKTCWSRRGAESAVLKVLDRIEKAIDLDGHAEGKCCARR